ncbi:carboxylating nicotinate-nucleotide diphosphorylase [Virgibacillus sp. DJP39]|uniref:carboxylating nicotinate-nucleotide diphosphorylase n=1 Tax=Virgibacillus sp. DJP39 TaxID=3409790 RepID=UPI003BB5B503
MNQIKLQEMLRSFLIEDIGDGDCTSSTIFQHDALGRGIFYAKAGGILSGLQIIRTAYQLLDSSVEVTYFYKDGDSVTAGESIAEVAGPIVTILGGERVILNLIQRMSGIASMTRQAVETLNDGSIQLCDTRKTTPGLRMLEKYAVVAGGGKNHRFGLYDGIMIKDNHISFCGSITRAVAAVREKSGHMVKVEVETESREQVLEAVEAGADVIMFDNRKPAEVREFTNIVPKHINTEASGGITLKNLSDYADTGVDFISLGFLTHSVTSLDISLLVK